MFNKIIHISLVLIFSFSSPAYAVREQQELTYNTVVTTISSLWKKENQLRQTWSYSGLVLLEMAAPVLEYSTLGIWGILGQIGGSVAQYNASPLLKKLTRFLPSSFRPAYENVVDEITLTFHTSAIGQNPSRYGSGYLFGAVGVYIASHIFDKCPTHIKEEVEGFTYFCFKKAGFYIHDHYEEVIYAFLDSIPQALHSYILPGSSCALMDEQQCTPFVNPTSIPPLDKDGLKELEMIRQSRLTLQSNMAFVNVSNSLSKAEQGRLLADFYNRTAPLVMSFIHEARKDGKQFGIILGETHNTSSCFLIEIELFKLLRHQSTGKHTLFVETTPKRLQNHLNCIQKQSHKNCFNTSSEFFVSKIAYGLQAGFLVKAAEPKDLQEATLQFHHNVAECFKNEFLIKVIEAEFLPSHQKQHWFDNDSLKADFLELVSENVAETGEWLDILAKETSPQIMRKALSHFKSELMQKHTQIEKCLDFRARDKGMVGSIEEEEGDFTQIVGGFHLGSLHKLLKIKKDRVYLVLTCTPEDPTSGNTPTLHKWMKRYSSQECLDDYIAHTKDGETFKQRSNPCLTFTINDEELIYK